MTQNEIVEAFGLWMSEHEHLMEGNHDTVDISLADLRKFALKKGILKEDPCVPDLRHDRMRRLGLRA